MLGNVIGFFFFNSHANLIIGFVANHKKISDFIRPPIYPNNTNSDRQHLVQLYNLVVNSFP